MIVLDTFLYLCYVINNATTLWLDGEHREPTGATSIENRRTKFMLSNERKGFKSYSKPLKPKQKFKQRFDLDTHLINYNNNNNKNNNNEKNVAELLSIISEEPAGIENSTPAGTESLPIIKTPTGTKSRQVRHFTGTLVDNQHVLNGLEILGLNELTYCNYRIDLLTGLIHHSRSGEEVHIDINNNNNNKKRNSGLPHSRPLLEDEILSKRYYIFAAAIKFLLDVELSSFMVRLLTASIMAPLRFQKPDSVQQEGCSLLELNDFTLSKEGMLTVLWNKTLNNSETIISVADELNHIRWYQYTNSVPTHREIKESEAVKLVKNWYDRLFVQIPKEVDTTVFILSFLKYLASTQTCTISQFDDKTPVGSFFCNTVASVNPESEHVIQIPYGPDIVSPQEIIEAEYHPLETAFDEGIGSDVICLSKATKDFLNVICGSSEYNLNVFRLLIRDSIVSPFEGRFRQSAVYLYGAPGTSKSVWAEVLKRIIPKKFVQEFSRSQNQFTANQLQKTRLLIVSDLTEMIAKQRDVLKRILGRDSFTKEEKFEKEFGLISPYCQVFIISNYPPKHFELFAEDQALLDKLVQVELGSELQITAKDRISNLGLFIDSLCTDLFNWALHCKSSVLPVFVRADELNKIFSVGKEELTGLPAFINTCVYQLPGNFLPLRDLKTAFLEFLGQTGEDKELFKRLPEAKLGELFIKVIADECGYKLNITRYSRRDKGLRQLGLSDLACTDGQSEFDRTKYEGLVRRNKNSTIVLADPFATDKIVVWANRGPKSDRYKSFSETQERILATRLAEKRISLEHLPLRTKDEEANIIDLVSEDTMIPKKNKSKKEELLNEDLELILEADKAQYYNIEDFFPVLAEGGSALRKH